MSDLNRDARRLVELARKARTPGPDDKRRIAERLAVPLAAGAALGAATGGAKAAAGAKAAGSALFGSWSSLGVKIAAAVAVSAAAAAVVMSQVGGSSPARVPPATPTAPAAQKPLAPPSPPAEQGPSPSPIAEPEPTVKEALTPAKPAAAPSHTSKAGDELEQEAALLHRAQSAWRAGQSAQALQLANQHAQRFPHSQLANERDVLRVLSLCKLGQASSAKQVGARLLRTAKGSPWYQSVADSCAAQ